MVRKTQDSAASFHRLESRNAIGKTIVPVLLLFAAPALFAQKPKRALKPEDFARIKSVSDPQLSPDAQWVAYTVSGIDLEKDKADTDVWMVSWDGTTNLRLTSSPDGESSPRWSPDGKYLSFTSSRQEGKGSQIWLLDRRGGEAQRLTQVKGGISSYSWSPDAKKIVFLMTDQDSAESKEARPKPIVVDRYAFKSDERGYLSRKRSHVYLFDVVTKQLDTLTAGDFDDSNPLFSPDGRWIAFSSKREGDDPDRLHNSDLYVIEAKKGSKPRRITDWHGSDSGPVAWSPDGKFIYYYQGLESQFSAYNQNTLARVASEGGAPMLIGTNLDRDPAGGQLTADGTRMYIIVTDDRRRYLAKVNLEDHTVAAVRPAEHVIGGMTMRNNRIAVTRTEPHKPYEIYALDSNGYRQLTHLNDEFINTVKLGAVQGIEFVTKDSADVHAMLYLPADYKAGERVPALVRIHGGPNGQDGYEFNFERQLFASNGYAVVSPNYRGSNGRGAAWKRAIYADWGNKEVVDVLAAADALVARGIADPARLGIGGWSYGCITTDYAIATDQRFKAATCGAGSALQLSMYGSDQYIVQYEQELGPPWQSKDLWIKLSWPFFEAHRIRTPTLFLGGEKDFNVPLIGGEQMYQALKSLGVPTRLIIYPNEHHGIRRPSFVKDMFERYLAWYAQYLKPQAASAATP